MSVVDCKVDSFWSDLTEGKWFSGLWTLVKRLSGSQHHLERSLLWSRWSFACHSMRLKITAVITMFLCLPDHVTEDHCCDYDVPLPYRPCDWRSLLWLRWSFALQTMWLKIIAVITMVLCLTDHVTDDHCCDHDGPLPYRACDWRS